MPKEILLQIIEDRLYFSLAIIIVVYLSTWVIMIKLGLIINRVSLKTSKIIFPWVLLGIIYSLFGKLIIPDFLYFFTTLLLLFIFLVSITRKDIIVNFFAAVISLLASIFSLLLLGQPLLVNSNLKLIFLRPMGIVIGSIIEMILPVFFYILLGNSMVSSKKKHNTNSLYLTFNIILLFLVYCLFAVIFYILANYHSPVLWQVIISEGLLICLTLFVFFRFKVVIKKEQLKSQEEQSNYLLNTILAKQREYRNFFQVIRAMVECGKTQEIIGYIDQILTEMAVIDELNGGGNPIFTSLLISEQIKAKENGITITTKNETTLSVLKEPIKVYQILKELVHYFVAFEEGAANNNHHIKLSVKENENFYLFKIRRIVEEQLSDKKEIASYQEKDHELQQIEKIIKELHGEYCYLVIDDELIGFNFKIPKETRKRFWFPLFFDT